MRTLIRYGSLTCAIILGACSTEPNGATPLLDADVAQVVADNTGEDVDIMREPVFFSAMTGFGPIAAPPASTFAEQGRVVPQGGPLCNGLQLADRALRCRGI